MKTATKPTKKDAERFIRQSFSDAISWKAAGILITRVMDDPKYAFLDPDLRGAIERFVANHPVPVTQPAPE